MIHSIEFRAMSCRVNIQLEAADGSILDAMPEELEAIESRLSRFRPMSELMQLNAGAGTWVPVSDLLFANVQAARQAALLTDGRYNPLVLKAMIASGYVRSFDSISGASITQPQPAPDWHQIELRPGTHEVRIPADSAMDLGGIAKGWSTAYVADALSQYGPCLVNIGGDMTARSAPDGWAGWPVEIKDPIRNEPFATVYLSDMSIATSGVDRRRWEDSHGGSHNHIINPATGQSSATDVLTVTVIHPQAELAEAYTKSIMLRGSEAGLDWLNQQWHAAGLVFRQDGAVLSNSTFNTMIHERSLLS